MLHHAKGLIKYLEKTTDLISDCADPFELSVELCNDEHISALNKEWRGKSGPTDVLSFETDSPPGYPMQLLGDVVISVETAERQAAERK